MKSAKRKTYSPSEPIVEPLEPRVLFSADPFVVAVDEPLSATSLSGTIETSTELLSQLQDDSISVELVFVSELIPEHESIKTELLAKNQSDRVTHVYTLGASDGISQVTETLALHNEIDAVHIISHGQVDKIQIGVDILDQPETYASQLSSWSNHLSESADLLFYGCNIAEFETGRELLNQIATITGAGVSASTDSTGPATLDGNWALEFETELIESSLLADGIDSSTTLLEAIYVDDTADVVDAPDLSSLENFLLDTGGEISFREAILVANTTTAEDTIYLPEFTYNLNPGTGDAAGDLDIRNPLNIIGLGPDKTRIDGGNNDRIFEFQDAVDATIYGVEIRDGSVVDGGGGIYSSGTNLTLDNVEIKNSEAASGGALFLNTGNTFHFKNVDFHNTTSSGSGGSIYINRDEANVYNNSALVIEDSTINNSDAGEPGSYQTGGAIWNGGSLSIYRSHITDNTGASGGGIFNKGELYVVDTNFKKNTGANNTASGGAIRNEGTVTVDRSLFFQNSAVLGGAVSNDGTAIYSDSNFSDNSASFAAGAIYQGKGTSEINRSTIADNSSDNHSAIGIYEGSLSMAYTILERNTDPIDTNIGAYTGGTFESRGYNISEFDLPHTLPTDLENTLANVSANTVDAGGYTETHTVGSSSPAVDAGEQLNSDPNSETIVDVTGRKRDSNTDIGAFEYIGTGAYTGPAVTVNKVLTVDENSTSTISVEHLIATDPDLPAVDWNTIEFEIQDPLTQHGTLLVDDNALSSTNRTFTLQDITDNKLKYQHSGSVASDSFQFIVSDAESNSTSVKTFLIDVIDVNDAPIISAFNNITVVNNQPVKVAPVVEIIEDGTELDYAAVKFHSGFDGTQDTLDIVNDAGTGSFGNWDAVNNILHITGRDSVENFELALQSVEYQNTSTPPNTAEREIEITVKDTLGAESVQTAKLNFTTIDVPPEITGVEPDPLVYTENSGPVQVSELIDITDFDSPMLQSAVVKLPAYDSQTETLSGDPKGNISRAWNAVTGELHFSGADDVATYVSALNSVKYDNINENLPSTTRSIDFTVVDTENLMSGVASRDISLLPVNDEPAGSDGSISAIEDQVYEFKSIDFGFSDDAEEHNFLEVNFVVPPDQGQISLVGVGILGDTGVSLTVSVADIDAGLLRYIPPANDSGTSLTDIRFTVTDNGPGGIGPNGEDNQNTDTSSNLLTVNVAPVNDKPLGSDGSVDAIEDQDYAFNATDFGFSDPDDGHSFLEVNFTQLPSPGQLSLVGVGVLGNTGVPLTVSVTDINAGLLRYAPPANASGNGLADLQFTVTDNGPSGIGPDGEDNQNTDTTSNTLTINVLPANDAPAGIDGPIDTTEDQEYVFKAADFGFSDPDGHSFSAVNFTQLPAQGQLSLVGVGVLGDTGIPLTVSVADINAGLLRYTSPANANGNDLTDLQFTVTDNGPSGIGSNGEDNQNTDSSANTLTVNVAAVNDEPVGSDGDIYAIEDQEFEFNASDFGFSDAVDGHGFSAVNFTQLPAQGQLSLTGIGVLGDAGVPLTVSVADINAGLLRYTPPASSNSDGLTDLQFTVTDNGPTGIGANGEDNQNTDSSANTLTVNVAAVNDEPVGSDGDIYAIEDQEYEFNATDFGFSDAVDGHGFSAVNFTQLPALGQLSLVGVGVLGDAGVPLTVSVAEINAGLLRFTPPANSNGDGLSDLQFTVTDNGPTGIGANGEDNQNTDSSANTLTVNVAAVNDEPVGSDGDIYAIEDQEYEFNTTDFGFSDAVDGHGFSAVNLTQLPALGQLSLTGIGVLGDAGVPLTVSVADINAGLLRYTPPANANDIALTNIQFTVSDSGPSSNGPNGEDNQNTDSTPNTLTVHVSPVNDEPIGRDGPIDAVEDQVYQFNANDFGFSDPHDGHTFFEVSITQLPSVGKLSLDGVGVLGDPGVPLEISVANIEAGLLRYAPPANANGNGLTDLQFTVTDNGPTGIGPNGEINQNTDTSHNTLTINITPVNDDPNGLTGTIDLFEDEGYIFDIDDFGFSDPIDGHGFHGVKFTQLPAVGQLSVSNTGILGQPGIPLTVSVADIIAKNLRYDSPANANGTTLTSLQFKVIDDGPSGPADINTNTTTDTLTINVAPVNDKPSGTSGFVNALEDRDYIFGAEDFGFSDTVDGHGFHSVIFEQLPDNGELLVNGVAVTTTTPVLVDDINANLLRYKASENTNGNALTTILFKVVDDGPSGSADNNSATTASTLTVNVAPVNDAPLGANLTVTTPEDTAVALSLTDFGFTDALDGHNLAAIKIVNSPGNNTLTLDGNTVLADQEISSADIEAQKLVFTPLPSVNGDGYGTLVFKVIDDGGTPNSGDDTSLSDSTLTFNITAQNDPPIGTSGSVYAIEDEEYLFDRADFGFSDPQDSDNFAGVLVTHLPDKGELTINGAPVTTTIPVSAQDIDASQFRYKAPENVNGIALSKLLFKVVDDGPTGFGHSNTDKTDRTLTINVESVNDPPIAETIRITTEENTPTAISPGALGYIDIVESDSMSGIKISTLPSRGELSVNGVPVAPGQFISIAKLNAGALIFTPDPADAGANYTFFNYFVVDDGGTDNGGQDTSEQSNQIHIDVTPANTPPLATDTHVATQENQPLQLGLNSFDFQNPANGPQINAIVVDKIPLYGRLDLNGVTVSSAENIPLPDIQGGNLWFVPPVEALEEINDRFEYRLIDNGGISTSKAVTSAESYTMTVDIMPVNNAPVAESITVDVEENANYIFTMTDFPFTDSPENHSLESVIVDSVPEKGDFHFNGIAVTTGQILNRANIESQQLVFTPEPNSYDTEYAGFAFRVIDTGGVEFGATATSQVADVLINVTKSRAIPEPAFTFVELDEDTNHYLTNKDLGLGGYDTSGPVAGIVVLDVPASGALNLGNTPVSSGQFVELSDINSSLLMYKPKLNQHGIALDQVTFRIVEKNGDSIIIPDDSIAKSATVFNVAPINDAPTNISLSNSRIEEHAQITELAKIVVDDIDARESALLSVDDNRFYISNNMLLLRPGVDIDFEEEQYIPLLFTATDESDASVEKLITLQVIDVHESPVANTDSITHDVAPGSPNSTLFFTLPEDTFSDPDGDNLIYTATLANGTQLPEWVQFNELARTITVETVHATGDHIRLTIVATDPTSRSAELQFEVLFPPAIAAAEDLLDTHPEPLVDSTFPVATETVQKERPTAVSSKKLSKEDQLIPELDFTVPHTPEPESQATLAEVTQVPYKTHTTVNTGKTVKPVVQNNPPQIAPLIPVITQRAQTEPVTEELLFDLSRNLDENKQEFSKKASAGKMIQVTSVALSSGLSVGYIIWLIRGGVIVASMMSAMPAWRFIDPLPVLDNQEDDADGDDESLESMVKKEKANNALTQKSRATSTSISNT